MIGSSETGVRGIEWHPDEVWDAISIAAFFKLVAVLQFKAPSELVSGEITNNRFRDWDEARLQIIEGCSRRPEIADKIGWELSPELFEDRRLVVERPLGFMRSLCTELDIDWLSTVDRLFESHETGQAQLL